MSTCSLRSGVHVAGHHQGFFCSWGNLLRSSGAAEGEAMIFFFFSLRIKAVIGACHEIQHLVLVLGHTCRHSGTCPNHRSMETLLVNPPGNGLTWNFWAFCLPSSSDQYSIAGNAACPGSGKGDNKKQTEGKQFSLS